MENNVNKNHKNNNSVYKKILCNYNNLNKTMVGELEMASDHHGISGSFREEMWMNFFGTIVPKKYTLAQGVKIIDSRGNISNEVDIAIYDEQYTPYVFQYGTLKFIPIEAVVVVIECKSKETTDKYEELERWVESIKKLTPAPTGIARIVTGYSCGLTVNSQKRTRPIRILATNHEKTVKKITNAVEDNLCNHFDFIIQKCKDSDKFSVYVENDEKNLAWWAHSLNIDEEMKDYQEIDGLKLACINISQKDIDEKSKEENTSKEESLKKLYEEKIKYIEYKDYDKDRNCEIVKKYKELEFNNKMELTNNLKGLEVTNNPFLSLNFKLNQLLMLINNPMLFPHYAYAKIFDEIAKNIENV